MTIATDLGVGVWCLCRPMGTEWTRLDGSLKHVTVSPGGYVWGVNLVNEIFYRTGRVSFLLILSRHLLAI